MKLYVHDLPEELQNQIADKTDRRIYKRTSYEWVCPVHGVYSQELRQKLDYGRRCNRCVRSDIVMNLHSCGRFNHSDTDWEGRKYAYKEGTKWKRIYPDWFIDSLVFEEDKSKAISGDLLSHDRVKVRCEVGHEYEVMVANYVIVARQEKKCGCPYCWNSSHRSKFEDEVYDFIGWDGKKNDRTTLKSPGGYSMELDILYEDKGIAIECDGDIFHQEVYETYEEYSKHTSDERKFYKWKGYHSYKDAQCSEKGIKLIHIKYSDWINNRSSVEDTLKSELDT